MIRRGSNVIAAVSGGSDSMALVTVLHELAGELGFSLAVAHFNHGIRPRASREKTLVERFCASRKLPLILGQGDVPAESKRTRKGLEETARLLRYRFLEKAARDRGADAVALGHTRDDQVETIMHHIIRGSGWRGLTGIPARRGIFIRPLLDCRRGELKRFLRSRHILYAADESNRDNTILRNRIRNVLLPSLRRGFNPSVDDALIRLSENLAEGRAALEREMRERIPQLSRDGAVRIPAERLRGMQDFELYLLIDFVLRDRFGVLQDIEKKHFDAAKRHIRQGRSGSFVQFPHGISLFKDQRGFTISSRESTAGADRIYEEVVLPGPGTYQLPAWNRWIEIYESGTGGGRRRADPCEAVLAAVRFPVRVRSRRPGDRMVPFGMKGRKKLSDIFIDKKIPVRSRDGFPVFEDPGGIIWVPGIAADERTRVTGRTRRTVRFILSKNIFEK